MCCCLVGAALQCVRAVHLNIIGVIIVFALIIIGRVSRCFGSVVFVVFLVLFVCVGLI